MCDQHQFSSKGGHTVPGINRRDFARLGAVAGVGAGLASCTTMGRANSGLTERNVSFSAPGGTMDGYFVHPSGRASPGVILWPDIAGLRAAKKMMARRLAGEGYAVFVANPYYRSVSGEQFADFEAWREGGGFETVGPWMERNTPAAIAETAAAVVSWLDRQEGIDTQRGIGNQGYCMTGSWTIRAAAAVPDRVKAAASFHGVGLVQEGEPTSPHNLFDDTQARFVIGIAQNDDAQNPSHDDILREAARQANKPAEIEVYPADHGWTVLDSPVYDEAQAEIAYANLLELYSLSL